MTLQELIAQMDKNISLSGRSMKLIGVMRIQHGVFWSNTGIIALARLEGKRGRIYRADLRRDGRFALYNAFPPEEGLWVYDGVAGEKIALPTGTPILVS